MPLIPLELPKGVFSNGTDKQSAGRYHDANLVRWYEDQMRPVGGWRKKSTTAITGMGRECITWQDNSGSIWAGIGSQTNLYAMTLSGALHDITPAGLVAGRVDGVNGGGYGTGNYGVGVYGLPIVSVDNIEPASVWSLDTWGQYMVGCMESDGKIYEWQLNTGTPAAQVANSPINCRAVLVTDQVIMMALGAGGNPRRVEWSDQEDNTQWTAAADNQAGGQNLQTNGSILTAVKTPSGVLIFTDTDLHRAQYVGTPFVFNIERVADGSGAISQNSVVDIDGQTIWMGPQGFWSYSGYANALPCDVSDHVFTNINRAQISKVTAFHNSSYGEVWWFYPDKTSTENNRYVMYSYREGHWSIGELDRVSAADMSPFPYPIMVGVDGFVYEHEIGFNHGGVMPYAEGGPIEIGQGDLTADGLQYIPDQRTIGDATVTFTTKFRPHGAEEVYGPYTASELTDVRFSGRSMQVRYDAMDNLDFRIGRPMLDIEVGGER